jgi:hypothetical protein
MALEYLKEVLSRQIDDADQEEVFSPRIDIISDILLAHNHRVLSLFGYLEDIPIVGGGEVTMFYRYSISLQANKGRIDRQMMVTLRGNM